VSQGVLVRRDQGLQPAQVLAIERLGRAEIHRYAVLHDAVLLQDSVQRGQRTAAIHHEVLRDDLEPAHHRFVLQDVPVVRDAETHTDPVIGEPVESICRHLFGKCCGRGAGTPVTEPCHDRNARLPFLGSVGLVGTVGGAAALTLASVLALAAGIAGLAAALALAGVLPLAGMLVLFACQMVPEDCPASELLEESLWPAELEETVFAFRRVIVPPSRPVNAAVSTKEPLETFMILYSPSFVGYSRIPQDFRKPAARQHKQPVRVP
jgi:hypothetical protein